jgi:hypothetical protein
MKRRRRNSGADFAQVRTSFNSEHRAAQSTLRSRVVSVTLFPASRMSAVAEHPRSSQSTRAGARGTSCPIDGPIDSRAVFCIHIPINASTLFISK